MNRPQHYPHAATGPRAAFQELARQRARARLLRMLLWVGCAVMVLWLLPLGAWAATALPVTANMVIASGLVTAITICVALYARSNHTRHTVAALERLAHMFDHATAPPDGRTRLWWKPSAVMAGCAVLLAAPALIPLWCESETTHLLWLLHSPAILLLTRRFGHRGLVVGLTATALMLGLVEGWHEDWQHLDDVRIRNLFVVGAGITILNGLIIGGRTQSWAQTQPATASGWAERGDLLHRPLREPERRLQTLLDSASDVMMVLDTDGTRRGVSPYANLVLGYEAGSLNATELWAFVHPEDVERLMAFFVDCLGRPGISAPVEFRHRHGNGDWRNLEAVINNRLSDAAVQGVVINARDITERKQWEAQLTRHAFYDTLTGLPNRKLFIDRLTTALTAQTQTERPLSVMFLDLDRFKVINDSLGHVAGDALLLAVAQRLAACVGPDDTVARFGGDEFVILLNEAESADQAMGIAERIIASAAEPFEVGAVQPVFTGVSVGVVVTTPPHDKPDHLLRHADTALYQAKDAGRGRAVLYEPSMDAHMVERMQIEADLRRALERDELRVFYQPLVSLQSMATTGYEALVRWQHPDLGLLPPDRFVPIAEESDLIVAIDRWVLRESCRQARAWQMEEGGNSALTINVNLSARQFQQPDLVAQVAKALEETGLPSHCLALEITEHSALQWVERTVTTLTGLKQLGVRVVLDDFGMGYSSLSYLQRFAVDTLKIDRFFVSSITHKPESKAIIQAITAMAHALGIAVTAEGIENAEHLRLLRTLGCDHGQGYYFAEPQPDAKLSAAANSRPLLLAVPPTDARRAA